MVDSDLDSDLGPPSVGSEMEVLSPHVIARLDELDRAAPPPPAPGGGVRPLLIGVILLGVTGLALAVGATGLGFAWWWLAAG